MESSGSRRAFITSGGDRRIRPGAVDAILRQFEQSRNGLRISSRAPHPPYRGRGCSGGISGAGITRPTYACRSARRLYSPAIPYKGLLSSDFADWRLSVIGLVEKPLSLTRDQLRAMPSRTQITRHDCVEGWSCIAKWTGTPLSLVLDQAVVKPQARYVMFHCLDTIDRSLSGDVKYYGTIDLIDASHPQTILAYGSCKAAPVENGAPLRVRVERQLGYRCRNTSTRSSWSRALASWVSARAATGKTAVTTGSAASESSAGPAGVSSPCRAAAAVRDAAMMPPA